MLHDCHRAAGVLAPEFEHHPDRAPGCPPHPRLGGQWSAVGGFRWHSWRRPPEIVRYTLASRDCAPTRTGCQGASTTTTAVHPSRGESLHPSNTRGISHSARRYGQPLTTRPISCQLASERLTWTNADAREAWLHNLRQRVGGSVIHFLAVVCTSSPSTTNSLVSGPAWIHSEQHRTRPGTCGDLVAGNNAVTSRERCCRFRSCS